MPTPLKGERWGILGGSFDPVHHGHISIALEIKNIKKLNGIFLIPSFAHPFKKNQSIASYDDRLEMLKLAVSDNDTFFIYTLERELNLSGYTIDTIKSLKQNYPQVEFYFIIGADNLHQLDKWHKPDEIIREVKLVSGNRPQYENILNKTIWSDKIELLDTTEIDISSSELRKMLKEKVEYDKLSRFLNVKVYNYISKKELYR